MRLCIMMVAYIYLQAGFDLANAKGGGGRGGGGGGGRGGGRGAGRGGRGSGGIFGGVSRGSRFGRPFTPVERLSSRYIIFRSIYGGGYALSGHISDECIPPSLNAYKIKDFVDVTKNILTLGGTSQNFIELAEQFMSLNENSSIQTWFDLNLKLFNVQTTQSNLSQILGIHIPRDPVDDNLSGVFSGHNNDNIEIQLLRSSSTLDNAINLTTYLRIFNTDSPESPESFLSSTAPRVNMCYARYKHVINPNNQNLLQIFPSLALLEHSMCRSGSAGKAFMEYMVEGDSAWDDIPETLPRTIKLGTHQEYVLSGHEKSECLPPLDAYKIKDFINVTKTILRMGGTTREVIELAEQFMKLNEHSSIQTWLELNLRLFDVTAMPLNLTAILGRIIPNNPLDDKLSVILSAENNDKIENALSHSPNVKDLMDYLRGFDDESYFLWIDYGVDICYEKYKKIVNPRNQSICDIFPSLAVLKDSMCRQGAENARQRSWKIKIIGLVLCPCSVILYIIIFKICPELKRRKKMCKNCLSN